MKDAEDVAENTTVVSASRGIVDSFQPQIEKAIYRGKFSYFIDSVLLLVATIVGSILQAFALFYTLFDAQTYCKRFPQSDYCGNTPDASSNRQQLIIRGVVAIVGGFITWQFIVIELIKDFCCIVPYEDWKRNKETQEI
ncbi:hypothetical protein HDV04_005374 [Boothiomyces sp. JEL0838]|nr:hypothetical protein HDV04_005374 [Boothiomyces sp. JEL0838]